jgi:hypothetical protein
MTGEVHNVTELVGRNESVNCFKIMANKKENTAWRLMRIKDLH